MGHRAEQAIRRRPGHLDRHGAPGESGVGGVGCGHRGAGGRKAERRARARGDLARGTVGPVGNCVLPGPGGAGYLTQWRSPLVPVRSAAGSARFRPLLPPLVISLLPSGVFKTDCSPTDLIKSVFRSPKGAPGRPLSASGTVTPNGRHRMHWSIRRTLAVVAAGGLCLATSASAVASATPGAHPATGTRIGSPITHLVVIFQENVSFDHYFGTYPHAANTDGRKFHARPGTPSVNGLTRGAADQQPEPEQPDAAQLLRGADLRPGPRLHRRAEGAERRPDERVRAEHREHQLLCRPSSPRPAW